MNRAIEKLNKSINKNKFLKQRLWQTHSDNVAIIKINDRKYDTLAQKDRSMKIRKYGFRRKTV